MSDLTEGKLKTVIVDIEDVLSEDTTVFATSSSETKILSKDYATSSGDKDFIPRNRSN